MRKGSGCRNLQNTVTSRKTSILAWPTFNACKESLARLRSCTNCSELSRRRTYALLNHTKRTKRRFKTNVHARCRYMARRITKVYFWEFTRPPFACRFFRPLRSLFISRAELALLSRAALTRTPKCQAEMSAAYSRSQIPAAFRGRASSISSCIVYMTPLLTPRLATVERL